MRVDLTFNLGQFYVTPMTYSNPLLVNKVYRNKAAFCGPVLINFKKTTYSYSRFFETINKCVPELELINAIGTDGE